MELDDKLTFGNLIELLLEIRCTSTLRSGGRPSIRVERNMPGANLIRYASLLLLLLLLLPKLVPSLLLVLLFKIKTLSKFGIQVCLSLA